MEINRGGVINSVLRKSAAASLALVVLVMMALLPSSASTTFPSSATATVGLMQAALASISNPSATTRNSQQRVERDPTRPPVDVVDLTPEGDRSSRVRTANLKLEFIRHSSRGSSSAVINNETYIIGDRIGGWAVKDIQADRVILIRGNEEIVLSVFSGLTRSSLRDNQ